MSDSLPFHKVMLDTALLIYFIEEHSEYLPALKQLFSKVDAGEIKAVTSTITLLEVLVRPKKVFNFDLEEKYLEILLHNENLEIVPLDILIARKAAEIRAKYGVKTPDAIQLATGINHECDAFLTNDKALKKVEEIKVVTIPDLLY
jgi:predicted nucleic acid-binding protein